MSTPEGPSELILTTGPAANGGSCVARHDGRVVFVRYALPGETVRARLSGPAGAGTSYWTADAVAVLDPAPGRIDSLCPIAGVDEAGCCDLAFADPVAARRLKGAVVANQLARLGLQKLSVVRYRRHKVSLLYRQLRTPETQVDVIGPKPQAGINRLRQITQVVAAQALLTRKSLLQGVKTKVWPAANLPIYHCTGCHNAEQDNDH